MNTHLFVLLLSASVLLAREAHAFGFGPTRDCLCQKYEARVIPAKSLRRIEILPKGSHCRATEVIAGLAQGEKVCLDLEAPWVKRLIKRILEKKKLKP